jgi:hypothetical protein
MELSGRAGIIRHQTNCWRAAMRKFLAITLTIAGIAIAPTMASAGERMGDAAGGAVAGALVAGPVGLVAGGIIGYTAGPHISRGLGINHRHYRHYTYRNGRRVYY